MIDIIIVTYNSERYIKDCVESIMKFTDSPKTIYVTDNGSMDGTIPYLRSQQEIRIIENEENLGYAKAVNQAIRLGSGENIAIMNPDTMVTEGWLKPLLECLDSDPRIGIVSPKMINKNNQLVGVGANWDWTAPHLMQINVPGLLEENRDCLAINGACFLIKRDNLDVLGLLDEHYFFYFEETDYCFNANHLGFRVVFCPQSVIYHDYVLTASRREAVKQYWKESEAYFNSKWACDYENKIIYKKI